MKTRFYLFIITIIFLVPLGLWAQEYEFSTKNKKALKQYTLGESAYTLKDNQNAIEYLKKAVKADKNFIEAWLLIGDAYTEVGLSYEAIAAYENAIRIDPSFFPRVYFFVGNLKYRVGEYDDAINYFIQYKGKIAKGSAGHARVVEAIEKAEFAQNCINNPIDVDIKNLGELVNSQSDDYINFVSPSNNMIMLTRKELAMTDDEGRNFFIEHFYKSYKVEEQWKSPDSLDIDWDEGLSLGGMNISVDGRKMYFTGCNLPSGYGGCDLYFSYKRGNKWTAPMNMGTRVNSQWWDSQPMVSSNGKLLLFSSRRSGTKGGSDIWMSIRLASGKWSPPINLGDSINTRGNEMAPFLHADGKTLYFSSDGHKGLGGSDIYISRKDETGRWSKAVNLGYPINTYHNEINFFVTLDASEAWFSSDRPGGSGKVDIYSMKIGNPISPNRVVFINGKVKDKQNQKPLGALIELTDVYTAKVLDTTYSDNITGEFLLVLQPGINYAFNISKKGYVFYSENYNLEDSIKLHAIEKEFFLSRLEKGTTVILENVFFDFDKSTLKAESYAELDRLFKVLDKNESVKIKIDGHTDNVGLEEYNFKLSENRARSVYDYLVEKGITPERLNYQGFGDTQPLTSNNSEEGRAKNRRTEITLID